MNTVYLILGSNEGDKLKKLQQAIHLIEEEIGAIIKTSGIYTTAAWGNTAQPDFVNQVICVHSNLAATNLLRGILQIEKKIGRTRDHQKWVQRIIDIDMLFYNTDIINSIDLTIPHPYIQDRKFVLIPLLEIAPDLIHPVFNKNIKMLLEECKDELEVMRMKD